MSAREKFLQEIDYMSDEFFDKIYTMWIDEEALEIPNAETIAALEELEEILSGKRPHGPSFDSFDEMMKYVDEMEDEDDDES
jgi:hypothetical protein